MQISFPGPQASLQIGSKPNQMTTIAPSAPDVFFSSAQRYTDADIKYMEWLISPGREAGLRSLLEETFPEHPIAQLRGSGYSALVILQGNGLAPYIFDVLPKDREKQKAVARQFGLPDDASAQDIAKEVMKEITSIPDALMRKLGNQYSRYEYYARSMEKRFSDFASNEYGKRATADEISADAPQREEAKKLRDAFPGQVIEFLAQARAEREKQKLRLAQLPAEA